MTLAQANQMLGRGGGGNDSLPPPWVDQKIQGKIGLKFVQNVVFQRFFYIYEDLKRSYYHKNIKY